MSEFANMKPKDSQKEIRESIIFQKIYEVARKYPGELGMLVELSKMVKLQSYVTTALEYNSQFDAILEKGEFRSKGGFKETPTLVKTQQSWQDRSTDPRSTEKTLSEFLSLHKDSLDSLLAIRAFAIAVSLPGVVYMVNQEIVQQEKISGSAALYRH